MKKTWKFTLLSFLVIYMLNFFLPRLMPGDPFRYAAASSGEDNVTVLNPEQEAHMRAYYGLDKPLAQQFLDTVGNNLRGEFGFSIHYKRAAAEVIRQRLPWTALIMAASLVISLAAGSLLALWCVRSPGADRAVFPAASFLAEIPPYLIGLLLLFLVAARVEWLPLSGGETAFMRYEGPLQRLQDILVHSLLPIAAMCLFTAPKIYFTARASFLSVVEKPYMLHAKAKGLREGRIRWRYLWLNGITPVVARVFLLVGDTVGGTLLVENVFAYPGLGTVMREAVKYRDFVMIQAVFLLSAVIVLLSLLAADLLGGLIPTAEEGRGM